jgi:hypothetical protein
MLLNEILDFYVAQVSMYHLLEREDHRDGPITRSSGLRKDLSKGGSRGTIIYCVFLACILKIVLITKCEFQCHDKLNINFFAVIQTMHSKKRSTSEKREK